MMMKNIYRRILNWDKILNLKTEIYKNLHVILNLLIIKLLKILKNFYTNYIHFYNISIY